MPAGHAILCGPAAVVSNLEDTLSSMPPLSVRRFEMLCIYLMPVSMWYCDQQQWLASLGMLYAAAVGIRSSQTFYFFMHILSSVWRANGDLQQQLALLSEFCSSRYLSLFIAISQSVHAYI